ncbi:DUF2059 domain-containing protein [Desulfomicrobium orale]|uniref:DUF2059 domain-containing protein n=1 Tax=Desulfomicrobium orale DSM 12838 TaxID=888061 RepID=A0A0X8JQF5_9BACT|nr:DUF2059 domain-containing protein [Desulfomicrobium orale]AMD92962.1 hypothetical protein AXF15_07485 [Desulfomicrobium orale DSM 12838]
MKRLILTLCLVLACGTAYSGEKEHRALAEELIKITDGDKVMDGMKAQVSMVFQQITSQMNVQEADKPKLEKYTKRFEDILKEDMDWGKVRTQYVDLYTGTFTEKEIKSLVDFYKSDLGKKVSEKMPELMQKSMLVARTHMEIVVPKLEALTEEMRKEFEPAAPAAPAGAAPAKSEKEAPKKSAPKKDSKKD